MQTIKDSELILNSDGSIYHLNLLPAELAEIIILVGDPGRVPEVSKHFDSIEVKKSKRELVTHTGYFNKKRVSVVSTGMGTDNIDIVINELDALTNIDLNTRQIKSQLKKLTIFRFGTSGALQTDIPLDSLVASSHGVGFDCLMPFYQRTISDSEDRILKKAQNHFTKSPPFYVAEGCPELLNKFAACCFIGMTATASGFYGPQGRILRAPVSDAHLIEEMNSFYDAESDSRIANFEMETSGIYGLGKLLGHHCCSINTIVANRVNGEFSADPYKAVENMIATALPILTN